MNRKSAKLSQPRHDLVIEKDVKITMRDGAVLYADIFRPKAAGRFPAIVNISAPQSWLPTPMQIHVCAAKAGIDQVTRTAAMEWGPKGIRVNAIAPGPIADTEGMRRLAPMPAAEKAWTDSVPLRRWGTKQEIAKVVQWLCSDDASYISGVILPVDGGWSLGGSSAMARAVIA